MDCVGGEVGEGMLGEGCPEEMPPPFRAERCEEERTARSAAAEGSSAVSIMERSCIDWPRWVGEAFLGVSPR